MLDLLHDSATLFVYFLCETTVSQVERTHTMAEEPRGVSDSSAALVASSINGGGCLPPPTPSEKIGETLGKHMIKAVHPEETNYRDALPTSLAWRTTTQTMMVGGLAGEVTEEELAKIPLDLTSGPPCQECLRAPSAGPVERASAGAQRPWHAQGLLLPGRAQCHLAPCRAGQGIILKKGRRERLNEARRRGSAVKRRPWQCLSSAPASPLETPPISRPGHLSPNLCLGCSSPPPPKTPSCHSTPPLAPIPPPRHPPRPGDLLMWETASMSANVTVFGTERAYR